MAASHTHSREQIAALAENAALGAGLSPVQAKAAAQATDWLRARGVEACDPLLALLFQHDETGAPRAGPAMPGPVWQGAAGWLCPIACGTALSDCGPLSLRRVALPILLLPFAARLARDAGRPVAIGWRGGGAVTDGDAIAFDPPPLMSDVTLGLAAGDRGPQARPRPPAPAPDQMILASLSIYAARARANRAESA